MKYFIIIWSYLRLHIRRFGYGHSIKNFVVRRMKFESLKMNSELGADWPGSMPPGRRFPIALLPRPPPPPSGSSRALSRARAAWSAAANLEIYETTLIHELHIDQIKILTVCLCYHLYQL